MLETAPERLVWGTDWPHVMTRWHIDMPNDGEITDLLGTWVPDEKLREQILVHNHVRRMRNRRYDRRIRGRDWCGALRGKTRLDRVGHRCARNCGLGLNNHQLKLVGLCCGLKVRIRVA